VPITADMLKVAILAITLVMVLRQFGVQTASLVGLVGGVAFGAGLALQGTLSNTVSRMMLLTLRGFHYRQCG